MKPLNDLLKTKAKLQWDPEQDKSYAKIKQAIIKAPTLPSVIQTSQPRSQLMSAVTA